MAFAPPGTLVAVGLFVALLGVLIRYVGWVELVAGYDPERVADEEGLANFVGFHTIVVGLLTLTLGVLEYTDRLPDASWYWLAYLVVVLGLGVRMIRGSARFEASTDGGSDA